MEHKKLSHVKIDVLCNICGKVCKRKENLTAHKRQKHGEVKCEVFVGTRVCSLCQLTMKRTEILAHMKDKHPNNSIKFTCNYCDKSFPFKSKLIRHMTQHEQKTETLVCEICSFETKSEESLRRHIRRHENRIKCNLCEYSSERCYYS